MTQFIFMNHRIKYAEPGGPVIVCQQGSGEQRESNEFEILYRGQPIGRAVFEQRGLEACETHAVRAWVEFEDDVDIRPVVHAAAKKPGRKVFPVEQAARDAIDHAFIDTAKQIDAEVLGLTKKKRKR